MLKRIKGVLFISILFVFLLTGCNSSANNRIKELYGLGDLPEQVDSEERESYVGDGWEEFEHQSQQAVNNSNNIYDIFSDKNNKEFYQGLENAIQINGSDEKLSKRILRGYYEVYSVLRQWSPYIGVTSFVIGVLVAMLSTKNNRTRRFAIVVLCIGVPLLALFIIFGIGILNDVFFY